MRDAVIERVAEHLTLPVEGDVVAEVPPQPERDRRQVEAGCAHASIARVLVAVGGGRIGAVQLGDGPEAVLVGHDASLAATPDTRSPPARAPRPGAPLAPAAQRPRRPPPNTYSGWRGHDHPRSASGRANRSIQPEFVSVESGARGGGATEGAERGEGATGRGQRGRGSAPGGDALEVGNRELLAPAAQHVLRLERPQPPAERLWPG